MLNQLQFEILNKNENNNENYEIKDKMIMK